MEYFRIVLCGFLLASAMFTLMVSIYSYRKHESITKYFAFFCLSISFYSLGYALELYSNSLHHMVFWSLIQYIGLPFLPALWIIFTLEYTGLKTRFITKLSIFIIPVLTFIFRYTNSMHHIFYSSVQLTTNEYFPVLFLQKGPWYWVHAVFITSCFIVSNYLYFHMYLKSKGPIRRQSLIMLIASFLPWVSYVMNLFNISPLDIDYGPFAVTSSVILFFIAFLRYHFLNIIPLARDKIFESTTDGIIVLNAKYSIVDFNPSAASICATLQEDVIGSNIREVLGENTGLVNSILNNVEFQCCLDNSKDNYKVNTVKISESNGRDVGFIVTLTNITKYMHMMEELNYLASRDALTGVYNRRYFVKLSSDELERAKQHQYPLSMIILDLDFFKQINDSFGHQAGDAVLQEVANICRASIRSTDILGRYGGEEFVIFLPNTTLKECQIISERILTNVSSAEIYYEDNLIKVTASLGITGASDVAYENLDYFLKHADEALYNAKSDGRNCVRSIAAIA